MLNEKVSTPNNLLRQARERHGWTHKDVADQIGLPDSHTVGRWERGTSFPRPRYRRELCRIFASPPEALGLVPNVPEPPVVPGSGEAPPEAAPLASIARKPPFVLSPLVGREHEIAALRDLLTRPDVRLVTLFGSGGVGKTHLSFQVAQDLRAHFGDNSCFVSLSAVRDPALVIPTIAKELGIPEIASAAQKNREQSVLEQIKMILRPRRFLLVLDNFEQVMPASAFLEELLAECPQVKVLVTSRAVLYLRPERTFSVAPLALPDSDVLEPEKLFQYSSIALFVQRAQAARYDFHLTTENAPLVIEICQRLDGLPLALELAAARVRHLPLRTLLKQLASGFQLLKNEQRSAPERQRTLIDAIKWSYDLLNEQEQRIFRWLAIFDGGCTLEAIEALCSPHIPQEDALFDRVMGLVDRSLLRQIAGETEDERFMMLETIREYGLECLRKSNEWELCQRSHAHYYLCFVEQAATHLKGALQAEWLTRLDRELENLRVALAWLIERKETAPALRFAEAFGKFCGMRGYWSEELRCLEAVLTFPSEEYTAEYASVLARVLRRAGHLAYRLRNLSAARRWFKESIDLSRKLDDKQTLAGALLGFGWTLYRQNEPTCVLSLLQESVDMARWSGDTWSRVNALESLGRFLYDQGKIEDARQLLEESLLFARQLADRDCIVRILVTLIKVELAQGQISRAAELAQECFTSAQELNTRPLLALALENLAEVALFQENYERALDLLSRRISLAHEIGDRPSVLAKKLALSELELLRGNVIQASIYAKEGLKFFQAQGDTPNIVQSLSILGEVKRLQKEYLQATTFYKDALRLGQEIGNKKYASKYMAGLAKVATDRQCLECAALLAGCAEALAPYTVLYPAQQIEYQRLMQHVSDRLGKETFSALRTKGCTLSVEEALYLLQ